MTRILAVADEVVDSLSGERLRELSPDVVVSCGDLPFDYLEYLVTILGVPLLYVPGNHDPELRPRPARISPLFNADPEETRGPGGCANIDERIVDVATLRIAGLGGSPRYNNGPNQYTEAQMRRRAGLLELRAWLRRLRDGRGLDVLITHAPPRGLGDADDPAHRGFEVFHCTLGQLAPKLMIHGHVHPYGRPHADGCLGDARIVNAVGYRVVEVEP